jgi:hypothetical protein
MQNLTRKSILVCVALLHSANTVAANESWRTTVGVSSAGHPYANMLVQKHEFAMSLGCDVRNQKDSRLRVRFYAGSLPRLYAQDDTTARLTLSFIQASTVAYAVPWETYFIQDEPTRGAWMGSIHVGKLELDALASSTSLEILNKENELVYKFSTKGTAVGVKAIRKNCKLGL